MEQDKRSTHQARLSIGARPALRRTEIARLLNPNHGGTRCGWGLLLLLVSYPCVYAAPQGGKIVAGQGDISQPSVTTTVVKQATPRMAIDWQQFNIAEQEQVRFEQPSADAAVLNRIHDQRPSEILGSVQANGRVFLINPNGLLFGANAQVNVGALVASSLDLSSQAFMEGESRLQALDGEPTGMIINQGLLRAAAGGSISLVGAGVINQGTIEAYQGSVNLAAGRVATVAFDSDGLVRFQIDEGLLENATELSAAVTNQGVINAAGGQVLLSGHATQQVFDSAVNNEGVIRAGKIEQQGGVIRLVGVGAGVTNSGELDVSSATQATGGRVELSGSAVEHGGAILADSSLGRGGSVTLAADGAAVLQQGSRIVATGQQGGDVTLTGERVGLFADAQIDASGELAGGTVLIGGDLQGQGALPTARQTVVDKDVKIRADARLQGDAGKVIVWSDELTQYHGSIDISGGALDGAGGFAEVSGKQRLNFFGTVDASAPHGNLGTVLLDPKNIIIENAGVGVETDTVNFSDAADPGATDTRFDGDDLAALDANVVLQANNDITVNEAIPKTPGVGRTLTLQAGRSVLINANIATESGDVTIVANETVANGVVDGERDAGAAQITMADGITISAGNANINITMSTGAGLTNSTSGDITLEDLTTTGNITVTNNGTTANSDILSTSAGHRVRGNNVTLTTTSSNGAIGTSGSPVETSVSAGFTANAANGAGSMYIEEGGALLILSMDAGSGDISLGAGGQITEAAGQDTVVDITTDELRITGAAGVGTATLDALNLDVTSLRVDTSSSHLFFSDKENGLALRTVNANGNHLSIVALLGDITDDTSVLTANNLTLQASAGGVGIGGAINTTTAGTMTLTSGGAGSAGNITLAEANAIATSNVTLSTAGTAQTISLTTPGSITVDGNVGNSTDNLVLTTTGSNFVDGGATLTANDLTLTASNTNAVIGATGASAIDTAVSGSISATASSGTGGVFINNTGALNVASINAATGNVELAATGAITDSAGNDSVVDITANALTIASAAGVGSAALDALNASVDSLAITTSSADVFMTNAKDLALGTLNANANDLTLQVSGDITDNTSALTAATLSLTANGAGSTIGADGSAININLSAGLTASATSGAGGVYIDDAGAMLVTSIDAGSGDVKLTAGGVITDTAGDDTSTDITANNLTIASAAGLGVSASNSLNLDVNGLILTSSSADVYLTDASDLALGTINANANDLTIQALAGNLTDATSVLTAQDATLSVAGANAAIGADGVGININLSGSLTANAASGSGGVYIDAAGAMVVASIDAGSGVVKLDALGSITDAAGVDSVTDITANSLQVVSAAGLGASATDSLNLDVSDLSVASASGDVFLTNALALGVGTLNANANLCW